MPQQQNSTGAKRRFYTNFHLEKAQNGDFGQISTRKRAGSPAGNSFLSGKRYIRLKQPKHQPNDRQSALGQQDFGVHREGAVACHQRDVGKNHGNESRLKIEPIEQAHAQQSVVDTLVFKEVLHLLLRQFFGRNAKNLSRLVGGSGKSFQIHNVETL